MTKAIPGTVVFNPYLRVQMHKIADYQDGERAIYSDMMDKFVRHLKNRIKNHHQNLITIEGRTGSGKSTLAVEMARTLYPTLDLDDSYIYYNRDLANRLKRILNNTNTSKVNFLDEGSVILNSLNSRRSDDNDIVTLLDTLRSWGMTTIICIPKFAHLNKRVVDHLVDYRVVCPSQPLLPGFNSRGFYEIYKQRDNQWSENAYWDCIGAGVYRAMPPDIAKEYEAIKRQHQNQIVNDYIDKVTKKGVKDDSDN